MMGEDAIFALLERLYSKLGESDIRELFPTDLVAASRKSAAFFVQLMGGPPLFSQTYGPPRMRQRHLPFEIDEQARQQWLACFDLALEESISAGEFPQEELTDFRDFLGRFSAWMVNAQPAD